MDYKYQYEMGDIITDVKSGKLKILEQIKKIHYRKNSENSYDKGYKYQCLICNNIDVTSEFNLNAHYGCNVCGNNKTLVGYNDMWTTNPELAKLLLNPEDGYKYTENSKHKEIWRCSDCKSIIGNKTITQVNHYGLCCANCGDGMSIPEKIMYNILKQLNIVFITQLSKSIFNWCNKYRYDFYFESNNEQYIIETHGKQHYDDTSGVYIKTLEQEQENDKFKKELAIKNNIKKENYMIIDCMYSELEYIRNSILHSKLAEIFDLSIIDWLECEEFTCTSLVKIVCEIKKNKPNITMSEISKITKLNKTTICKYLKRGNKLGWCIYNAEKEKNNAIKNLKIINQIGVKCVTTNEIFNSIKDASDNYKIDSSSITKCCRGIRKSAGKHPTTNENMKWIYNLEDVIRDYIYLVHKEEL